MFNFQEELDRYKPSEEYETSEGLSGDEIKDITDIVEMILKGDDVGDAR